MSVPVHCRRHAATILAGAWMCWWRRLRAERLLLLLPQALDAQFAGGRLLAAIASRPGQCGRADGYILEGRELEFYQRKLLRRKGK